MLQPKRLTRRRSWMVLLVLIVSTSFLSTSSSTVSITNSKTCVKDDDFCDCGDDEPGTSACSMMIGRPDGSKSQFHCKDDTYFAQSIYLSRVGDRICDCCDGSDEATGFCGNNCRDTWEEIYKERRKKSDERQEGIMKRIQLVEESNKLLDEMKFASLKKSAMLQEYSKQIESLKQELIQEISIENDEFITFSSGALDRFKNFIVDELGRSLSRKELTLLLSSLSIRGKEESVENILLECDELSELPGDEAEDSEALSISISNYIEFDENNNLVREASAEIDGTLGPQKSRIPLTTEVLESFERAASFSRLTESSLWSLIPDVVSRARHVSKRALYSSFIDIGITTLKASQLDEMAPIDVPRESFKRQEVTEIKAEILRVEQKMARLNDHSKEYQLVQSVIGHNPSLYTLWGTCVNTTVNEYKYNICFFGDAKQNTVKLGHFSKYSEYLEPQSIRGVVEEPERRIKLLFEKGDHCFASRRPRTMEVLLRCGSEMSLVEISEPEVCAYAAVLNTPIACFD